MNGSTHDPLRKIQAKQVPDSKADIGSALKAARTKRGQSIEAVVSHTRIPKKFIEALEANHFDEFPAAAYLRGFLKTYCDYLEVDFDSLWKQLQPPPQPEAADAATGTHGTKADNKPHASPASTKAPSHHQENGVPPGALVALGAAVVIALVVALTLRGGHEKPGAVEPAVTPAALEPVRTSTEVAFSVEFLDNAWISVQADGRTVFEGFVPKNSRQEWKAKKTLFFRTNQPDALRLTVNGTKRPMPAPDATGLRKVEAQ